MLSIISILGLRLRKLSIYSQASVTKNFPCPTLTLPPISARLPPTSIVGSVLALSKIKDPSERLTIADEVLRLSVVEGEKAEPDPVIFHNGCLLLYDLQCEAHFLQYVDRYANLIEQAYGLEEKDLTDMKRTLRAEIK